MSLRRRHTKSSSTNTGLSEKSTGSSVRPAPIITRTQSLRRRFSCCFSDGQSSDSRDAETIDEKPRYVHVPQYAGEGHMSTTSPKFFKDRDLPRDTFIEPVQTSAQKAAEMRRLGRARAASGGRAILVGSS